MMNGPRVPKRKPALCRTRKIIEVGAEERIHLIEACAYFRADRHRPVAPDGFREQDRREAAVEIDAVIKGKRKN
jgi:hypothetical protein